MLITRSGACRSLDLAVLHAHRVKIIAVIKKLLEESYSRVDAEYDMVTNKMTNAQSY